MTDYRLLATMLSVSTRASKLGPSLCSICNAAAMPPWSFSNLTVNTTVNDIIQARGEMAGLQERLMTTLDFRSSPQHNIASLALAGLQGDAAVNLAPAHGTQGSLAHKMLCTSRAAAGVATGHKHHVCVGVPAHNRVHALRRLQHAF